MEKYTLGKGAISVQSDDGTWAHLRHVTEFTMSPEATEAQRAMQDAVKSVENATGITRASVNMPFTIDTVSAAALLMMVGEDRRVTRLRELRNSRGVYGARLPAGYRGMYSLSNVGKTTALDVEAVLQLREYINRDVATWPQRPLPPRSVIEIAVRFALNNWSRK